MANFTEKIYRGQNEIPATQYISQNKTLPGITFVCYDENSNLIDFSEAIITFSWKKLDLELDIEYILSANGDINCDVNGNLSYAFDVADTALKGVYYGQFNIEYSDGSLECIPANSGQCVVVV